MKKSGFSLVELVLSIVVIGISLMTVPLMLNEGAKSNQYALMQESILAARTKMGNILSFRWDENSTDINGSVIRVIDVAVGDSELDRLLTASPKNRRIGHVETDRRRRMTNNERNASLGIEAADVFDDIDDFDGASSFVSASAGGVAGQFDYLDNDLNLTTSVKFISDQTDYTLQNINFDFNVSSATSFTGANSTNIKMIELTTTSINRPDVPFVFRIFSSNIGQSLLYERDK